MQAAPHEFVARDLSVLPVLFDQEADEANRRRVTMPWGPWAKAGIQNGLAAIKR
jgi:hypothetical protein